MSHFKEICSCGEIISQCRCPGPKTIITRPNACKLCQAAKIHIEAQIRRSTLKRMVSR